MYDFSYAKKELNAEQLPAKPRPQPCADEQSCPELPFNRNNQAGLEFLLQRYFDQYYMVVYTMERMPDEKYIPHYLEEKYLLVPDLGHRAVELKVKSITFFQSPGLSLLNPLPGMQTLPKLPLLDCPLLEARWTTNYAIFQPSQIALNYEDLREYYYREKYLPGSLPEFVNKY